MRTDDQAPRSNRGEGLFVARRPLVALLAILALIAVACTGAVSPSPSPAAESASTAASPSAETSPRPQTSRLLYPMTLIDDEGTKVVLDKRPERIVSLTPAVTETLFTLGSGDRTVGIVDDPSKYPPEAQRLPLVAKFGSVDVEKIVALQADLVIAGGNGFNPPESIAKLRSLGIPVLVTYAPDVNGVFTDIELVGTAIGSPVAARDLTASMRAGFDQVQAATRDLQHPRTFYELDATTDIYGPAKGSFLEAMIALAGGDPITTGSTTAYNIPLETLVAADPQVIVLGDEAGGVTAEIVSKRPGWGGMSAVKSREIRPVDAEVVTRPGPRLVEGLRALALAIHPDLVLPSPVPLPSPGFSGGPIVTIGPPGLEPSPTAQ